MSKEEEKEENNVIEIAFTEKGIKWVTRAFWVYVTVSAILKFLPAIIVQCTSN